MFSTSSTASSVTEAPRRMFVPTWTWMKPSWPQPELSIGRELEALDQSHRCWETIGPALDLALEIIFPAVKALLEEQQDYLTERERIKSPVTFEMYMSGRRKEEANPTLLFCCKREQPRKRAKEVVKGSQILRDHPALRLAHSKRSPQARTSIRIYVGLMRGVETGDADSFGEVYCIAPVDRTCGVPVFVRRKDGSFRKATIGGIVQFDEKYYGLTVAHTFADNGIHSGEETEQAFSDMECSIDSDDNLSAPNEQLPAARFEEPRRPPRRNPREFSSFRTAAPSKALLKIDDDLASSSVVGNLFQYSTHTGLDWALIEIDNSRVDPKTCNAITLVNNYEERTLWPRAVVTTGPADREVLAITGDMGVIQGSMSRNTIYIRTAQICGFQELWTINMTAKIVEGDCGSWVVDRENGKLYGQIVAGHPGTGIGYVIPASQIFESVWQTLGDALVLPCGVSSKSVAPLPPFQWDDVRTQHSTTPRRQDPPRIERLNSSVTPFDERKITAELEFMFSNENLSRDYKFRECMDSQGFISVLTLFSIPRIQNLGTSYTSFCRVCESIPFLEVMKGNNGGGDLVRRWHSWSEPAVSQANLHEPLESISRDHEDDYDAQLESRDWGRRRKDGSESIAWSSVEDNERANEERYKKSPIFYARRASRPSPAVSQMQGIPVRLRPVTAQAHLPRPLSYSATYTSGEKGPPLPASAYCQPLVEDFFSYPPPPDIPVKESNFDQVHEPTTVRTAYEGLSDKTITRVLQRNKKDARRSERRDSSTIDLARPVYTKMSRRHLSIETLRLHRIDYEVDLADPDYVLVKRWVPEEEQEALWEHTRRIRSSNIPSTSSHGRRRRGDQERSHSRSSTLTSDTDYTDSDLEFTPRKVVGSKASQTRLRRPPKDIDLKENAPIADIIDVAVDAERIAPSPSMPLGPGPPATVASPLPQVYGSVALQPGLSLPEGWTSHLDQTSGHSYYFHVPTQIVQWELPAIGSIPPPGQIPHFPAHDGATGYDILRPAASVFNVASPVSTAGDEDIKKAGNSKGNFGPRFKVSDSKKSRGSKSKSDKSSSRGSMNVSEVSSDTHSSKQKPKDSNANPLLTFLAGGKKR